jgi:hypothetical protein
LTQAGESRRVKRSAAYSSAAWWVGCPCLAGSFGPSSFGLKRLKLKELSFQARWMTQEELSQRGLVVSKRMFTMHVPDFQIKVLKEAAEAAQAAQAADSIV